MPIIFQLFFLTGTATDHPCIAPGLLVVCSAMKLLLTLIGLILVLEGLPYLAFPEAMQQWLRQILAMEPRQLRIIGLLSVAAGLILCFVTQQTAMFP